MKKSEVIDAIDKCEPSYEQICRVQITAIEHIGDLMYKAAYNVYENIKQAILTAEDSEAGEWERLGENATVCSKCGKFKPFPDGIYGECHRLQKVTTIVKTDDYCSYAVPKVPPLPEYDDHDVSGLLDD